MVRGTRRGLTWGSRFLLTNRRLQQKSEQERELAQSDIRGNSAQVVSIICKGRSFDGSRIFFLFFLPASMHLLEFGWVSSYVVSPGGHWCLHWIWPLLVFRVEGQMTVNAVTQSSSPTDVPTVMKACRTLGWRDMWFESTLTPGEWNQRRNVCRALQGNEMINSKW